MEMISEVAKQNGRRNHRMDRKVVNILYSSTVRSVKAGTLYSVKYTDL